MIGQKVHLGFFTWVFFQMAVFANLVLFYYSAYKHIHNFYILKYVVPSIYSKCSRVHIVVLQYS